MNQEHARAILEMLADYFNEAGNPVYPGGLHFADDRTLIEHVEAALDGKPLPDLN